MKKIVCIINILAFVIMFSCENKPDPERLLSKTSINTSFQYELVLHKTDWAIGESTEEYELSIPKDDYRKITSEISSMKFFQKLDSVNTPIYAFDEGINVKRTNETACWYDDKYFYQIFIPNPASTITIELKNDTIMTLIYNDL